ncbi:MAG: DUF4931 domain-containing protein [Acidobacteriota bacterium]
MTSFRRDPLGAGWQIIAPDRMARPGAAFSESPTTPEDCPFCPGNEMQTPPELWRGGDGADWKIRVVPNKFPAAMTPAGAAGPSPSLLQEVPGAGAHEVIIETDAHDASIGDLTAPELEEVVATWVARVGVHWDDPEIRSVALFKNSGPLSGASIHHAHSQLLAVSMPTARAEWECAAAERWRFEHGTCLLCATLGEELEQGERIVAVGESFVALAPHASRFPYQLWIIPRRHQRTPLDSNSSELRELASMLRGTAVTFRENLGLHSYNWAFQLGLTRCVDYHWYLEAFPRLTGQGAFELMSASYINIVAPEEAAALIRPAFAAVRSAERTR